MRGWHREAVVSQVEGVEVRAGEKMRHCFVCGIP